MPKSRDGKYHFVNKAGNRFTPGKSNYNEHTLRVQVKDGNNWGAEYTIAPGERLDFRVDHGVTKIKIKGNIQGWPIVEIDMATPDPSNDLFVNIYDSGNLTFTVDYS